MEYITTKEASAKWGISPTRITILANEGRIPGAQHLGRSWMIPAGATKPKELKPNHAKSAKKEEDIFSLPLYHYRPDWNSSKQSQLSQQKNSLLLAETAVLECRFSDAFPILESILRSPEDIYTELGALWNAGICCIGLNKPYDFSSFFLRLQILLTEDFPHRDDMVIILDTLKTYVESIGSAANDRVCNIDIHYQCLPLTCLQVGYMNLSIEAMQIGAADTTLLELNLRLLESTSSVVSLEMMHLYLLGIYYLRHDLVLAERHAKAAVRIAYENKFYFPLVTYYKYLAKVLSPVLATYPVEFQKHCHDMISQYNKNYEAFDASSKGFEFIPKLTDEEYPYIYSVLTGLSNAVIAEKFGISQQTVIRRIATICEKVGVNNKKELIDYLRNNM